MFNEKIYLAEVIRAFTKISHDYLLTTAKVAKL